MMRTRPFKPGPLIRREWSVFNLPPEPATFREEAVKREIHFSIALFVLTVPVLRAGAKTSKPDAFQQGTVMKVEREEVHSSEQCCYSGSDTPLQSEYYAYDVSVRVGCGTYVGRYETAIDFLPSALTPNKTVPVRLTRHVMYFGIPGEPEMKMGIVHRNIDRSSSCDARKASR
jgi:hypothetical protein